MNNKSMEDSFENINFESQINGFKWVFTFTLFSSVYSLFLSN